MILCHCAVVSDADIDAAVDAGARTVRQVQIATACGRGCGGCLFALKAHLSSRLADISGYDDEVVEDAAG
jgi:bacterioferritin-associated ferredoxin